MKRLLTLALFPAMALAFEAGDYLASEEDILEALSREEISFTEYYELLELFRDKVDLASEELQRLLIVPGVDQRWIEAIYESREAAGAHTDRENFIRWFPFDFERISAFVSFEKRQRAQNFANAKIYSHGKFLLGHVPTNNLSAFFGSQNFRAEARLIDDEKSTRLRRRGAELQFGRSRLYFGSYDESFGNGLVMGKAFHVPGSKRSNSGLASLVTPVDNLFNGALFAGSFGKVGTGLAISRVVYDSVSVDAIASELSLSPSKQNRLGGVFVFGRTESPMSSEDFNQGAGSIFADFSTEQTNTRAEFGWTDRGWGINASATTKLDRIRSIASIWSYSDEFFPLHGNGESDYRYQKIELGRSGVTFDSRATGESGAKMKLTAPISENFSLDLDQSGWRTEKIGDWGVSTKTAIYYKDSSQRRLRFEYHFEKRTLTSGIRTRNSARIFGELPIARDFGLTGYFRLSSDELNSVNTDALSANLEVYSDLFSPLQLRLQISRSKTNLASSENGYWAMRFRNQFRSGPIIWLAEVRFAAYDKLNKPSLTEFRLTSSYYWR